MITINNVKARSTLKRWVYGSMGLWVSRPIFALQAGERFEETVYQSVLCKQQLDRKTNQRFTSMAHALMAV